RLSENKTPDLDKEIDFSPVPAPWLQEENSVAPEAEKVPEPQAEVAQKIKDAAVAKGLEVAKKEEPPKEVAKPAGGGVPAASTQSIRVNISVLEGLMQMASE